MGSPGSVNAEKSDIHAEGRDDHDSAGSDDRAELRLDILCHWIHHWLKSHHKKMTARA